MAEKTFANVEKHVSERDVKRASQFVEELSWIFLKYKNTDLSNFVRVLSLVSPSAMKVHYASEELEKFVPKNPNQLFLAGVLPRLFVDAKCFESNSEIADFAENVLGVIIPRWGKKSRFELIGHIVCHAASASDETLETITKALQKIAAGDSLAREVLERGRKEKKSWNEIIQQLVVR